MPERPRFSVVIATLRRPEKLKQGLDELARCDPAPFEVVVVDGDDGRSAEPVAVAAGETLPCPVRYVTSPAGLTRQRNVGLDEASGDVVVFADDDATMPPETFARLASAYADPTLVGVTGRTVEPITNRVGGRESRVRTWLPGGGAEGGFTRYGYPRRLVHPEVTRDVQFMPGCFMTARLDVARDVRFDEKLTGYALAEDEDFSCRLARRGRVLHLGDLVVHHDNRGFASRDTRAFGRQVMRNRTYLFLKNFEPTLLARLEFVLLLGVLVAHRAANRDLPGIRGLLEGAVEVRLGWRSPYA